MIDYTFIHDATNRAPSYFYLVDTILINYKVYSKCFPIKLLRIEGCITAN